MTKLRKPSEELNTKEKKFLEEYVKDFNASRAYRDAGFNASTQASAGSGGCGLLKKRNVKEALDKMLQERSERCKVDADYVLKGLMREAERFHKDTFSRDRTKALELIGKHINFFPTPPKETSQVQPSTVVYLDLNQLQLPLEVKIQIFEAMRKARGEAPLLEVEQPMTIPFTPTPSEVPPPKIMDLHETNGHTDPIP